MYDTTKPYKKKILELIQSTWETPHVSVKNFLVEKKFTYPEFPHMDGFGTKGRYHWKQRTFHRAVCDALAQNLNDLAVERAQPYALIDHILLPEDDHEAIIEIIRHLSVECRSRNIALCGGDTAIHDNITGLEISMGVMGFVRNPKPNRFCQGDVLVAIESNGLHANGFSKIWKLFGDEFREEFTVPTRIYHGAVMKAMEHYDIHGMVHVAGGAFSRLKEMVERVSDVVIVRDHSLTLQPIFREIYSRGVSDDEMYKTFNCGIGFLLAMSEEEAGRFTAHFREYHTDIVGAILLGSGKVKIQSQFSNKTVTY